MSRQQVVSLSMSCCVTGRANHTTAKMAGPLYVNHSILSGLRGKGGRRKFNLLSAITTCLWSSFYAETPRGGVGSEGQNSQSTSMWTGAEAPCPTVLARVQAYSPAESLVASTVNVRSWLFSSSSPLWYLHRTVDKEENIIGLQHSWQLINVINVLKGCPCATHALSKPYHSPVDCSL
jgi:hypothetical protein